MPGLTGALLGAQVWHCSVVLAEGELGMTTLAQHLLNRPPHHPDTALYQKEVRQLQAKSTKRWQQEIPGNSDIYVLSRSLKPLQVPKPGEEEWDQCVEERSNHR